VPEPETAQASGVLAAVLAGVLAAAAVLAAGVVIALVSPDASIVGTAGVDASLAAESFRQAVGTLLAPMVDSGSLLAASRRIHPLVLLAIPLAALALLMLVFAVLGGSTESTNVSVSVGNTFALGLLWGVVGTAPALGLTDGLAVPPRVRPALSAAVAALRPLAAVALACTALALAGWLAQVAADAGDVRGGRSVATALIEETVYAGEHGIHLTALAAGVLFFQDGTGSALGLPFPVDEPNTIAGAAGGFRIFAYDGPLPAAVFVPALVVLFALVILGALLAGSAAARAVDADRPARGAAWGAITGPAWALAMAAAVVLAGGLLHGDAADGSVLGLFALGGASLGAVGGALSARRM
jgi:hypothetical protein